MPSSVHDFKGYRIAIYSPNDHFALICSPGSNRVIDFKEKQPRATVVEEPLVCLERAEALVESLTVKFAQSNPETAVESA